MTFVGGKSGNARERSAGRCALLLATLLLVVCGSGASCPGFMTSYSPVMPRVLSTTPTLADVIAVVNNNSGRIHSLYTTDAEIYSPGAPKARANIALSGRAASGCGPIR